MPRSHCWSVSLNVISNGENIKSFDHVSVSLVYRVLFLSAGFIAHINFHLDLIVLFVSVLEVISIGGIYLNQ